MEIIDIVETFFSAVLGGLLSVWLAKRLMFSRDNIMETVDSILDYAINTVEGQSKVKAVMEKISEGLLRGTPFGKGQGKMTWKDQLMAFLISAGAGYAQKQGWLPGAPDQQQEQQQSSKPSWAQ